MRTGSAGSVDAEREPLGAGDSLPSFWRNANTDAPTTSVTAAAAAAERWANQEVSMLFGLLFLQRQAYL